jgi:hypothetical protein
VKNLGGLVRNYLAGLWQQWKLLADFSAFERPLNKLRSLGLETLHVPENIPEPRRTLVEKLSDEMVFGKLALAVGTRKKVMGVSLRECSGIDACMAAVRALRDGPEFIHIAAPA